MQLTCYFSRYPPDEGLCPPAKPFPVWHQPKIKGTGSRLCTWSLIKLIFSNLLLILLVNNPTHKYLSNPRVYFIVEMYFQSNKVRWWNTKIAEKISGLYQHYRRWIYCNPKVLFHGWLIYSYLQIFKLIKSKWLPGEYVDWYRYRRNSMSWHKSNILINEHALNREPVPLKW